LTLERYTEVLSENSQELFWLELDACEVGIIHSALRLMLMHPDVKEMPGDFLIMAEGLRGRCLQLFRKMGFSEDEVKFLDSDNSLSLKG